MDDLESIRRLKRGEMGGLETLMERYQVKAARKGGRSSSRG